jgi:hypothetical protein
MNSLPWDVLALFGGIQAALAGLLTFLGKIWISRILEAERLKLELTLQTEKSKLELIVQKSLHMQKTQYDTEFKICSDLWKELCSVRSSVWNLSFHRDQTAASGSHSLGDKRAAFDEAVTKLDSLTEINRPFFPGHIAKLLFELIGLANKEKQRDDRDRQQRKVTIIHAEAIRNLEAIRLKSDAICEAIRKRITGTVVMEEK